LIVQQTKTNISSTTDGITYGTTIHTAAVIASQRYLVIVRVIGQITRRVGRQLLDASQLQRLYEWLPWRRWLTVRSASWLTRPQSDIRVPLVFKHWCFCIGQLASCVHKWLLTLRTLLPYGYSYYKASCARPG